MAILPAASEPRSAKVWAFVIVGVLAVGLIAVVVNVNAGAFRSPTPSMFPTLEVGERVLAGSAWRELHRGDPIIFKYPLDRTKSYIKRIIGLGGDTIEMREGQFIVNEKPVNRQRTGEACASSVEEYGECTIWREISDGRSYRVAFLDPLPPELQSDPVLRNYGPVSVPAGHVFVVGDFRDESADSRYWGAVPVDLVFAKPTFIYWSSDDSGIRWNRMFHAVE